jgi:hypothetical protein
MSLKLQTEKPLFSDLVNNYKLFHKTYSKSELALLTDWNDNSDYSHVESVDDFLSRAENFTMAEYERSYLVRCPISYIFSSDKSLGGMDRPLWVAKTGDKKCRDNLNKPTSNGGVKGYSIRDALILSGMIRLKSDNQAQIVKYIGNNRVWMKLLANRGKDTEVLIMLQFHKPNLSQEEMLQVEADAHSTDSGDRSGQNETQKYVSNYHAKDENAVFCYNFLKEHELDYENTMKEIDNSLDTSEWLSLTSLQGLLKGQGNGYFKKFGERNVVQAIKTLKEIAKNVTHEEAINSTPIECFSHMYRCFTCYGKSRNSKDTIFTKDELHTFFLEFFKQENQGNGWNKTSLVLNDLSASGGVKDIVFISSEVFFPKIKEYWKYINDAKIAFGLESIAVQNFIAGSKDRFLLKEIRSRAS